MQISQQLESEYLYALNKIKDRCKGYFTHQELAEILEISRPTISNFMNIKKIDFILLDQIARLVNYNLKINLEITFS